MPNPYTSMPYYQDMYKSTKKTQYCIFGIKDGKWNYLTSAQAAVTPKDAVREYVTRHSFTTYDSYMVFPKNTARMVEPPKSPDYVEKPV